jgi:hypothetical protein
MSLLINKVTNSSIQINYNYFDSVNLFGYEVLASYTVDISDVEFEENNVLLVGQQALKAAYARKNIVARIGGDEFLNGRLTSLSFKETSLAGSTTATIAIQESKRLNSYSNNSFAQSLASPQWIESFQENLNSSYSDDSYSFDRSVSIKYKQDAGSQFLDNAKIFLNNFYFNNRPQYGNAATTSWKTNKTENFNLIDLSVSFTENFQSSTNIVNNISFTSSFTTSVDDNGFKNKSYDIQIKALKEPIEENALSAAKLKIDEIVSTENSTYGRPILIEKGISKDSGVITLKMSFTNNPNKNQESVVSYEVSKQKTGAYYEYQINISYASEGKNLEIRFQNVKNIYSSTQSTYSSKINSLFSSVGSIYEKSRSTSFVKHEGKINDNIIFSTDNSYNTNNGILKFKTTKSTTDPTDVFEKVIDLADLNEKIATSNNKGNGRGSLSMVVVPFKSKGLRFGETYLLNNAPIINGYIESDQISIDSANGTTTRTINYVTS